MKASTARGGSAKAFISVLAAALPSFLLGRRGGPGASVPSVKWGEIIGPVGTRLCEATSKAPGCGSSMHSPELVPVYSQWQRHQGQLTPQVVPGRPVGGEPVGRTPVSGLPGRGPQNGGSCGDRSAGSPRVRRDGAACRAVAGIRLRSISAAVMEPHVATEGG